MAADLTGIDQATDAIATVFKQRRDARIVARRALVAGRPAWEKPIREIHERSEGAGRTICAECMRDWPCPTIRSLGEFHKPQDQPKPIGYAAWGEALKDAWGMTGVVLGEEEE